MDKISVNGIRLYAYHGCLEEEGKIGTEYEVNVSVWGSITQAFHSDDLSQTMDYVTINRIVKEHMAVRHKLIETVANKILEDIFKAMPIVQKAKIKVAKLSPPINGDVEHVSIELKRKRKHYLDH
jgi:dihydroneopterin aldolase